MMSRFGRKKGVTLTDGVMTTVAMEMATEATRRREGRAGEGFVGGTARFLPCGGAPSFRRGEGATTAARKSAWPTEMATSWPSSI